MVARNEDRFITRLVTITCLAGFALGSWGCGQSASGGGTGGNGSGTGGSTATGGTSATGGASSGGSSSGGRTGSGGVSASGGSGLDGGATGGTAGATGGTVGASGGTVGASGGTTSPGSGGRATGGNSAPGSGGRAAGGSSGRAGATGSGGTPAAGGQGGGPATMTGTGGTSSACSGTPLPAGNTNRTIQIGSTSRTYILHVPSGYTGTKPVPLVLDFHALGGSGSQEQSSSGYQAIADKQGFIILFPNGIDNAWNIGPCCTNSPDVDDLGFAKGMVAAMVAEACIDTKRVYATGFSMGGGMCQYLACNAADMFAAVAPSSFDLLVPDEEPCAPSRPISVLAYRGTADTTVPYAGGLGPSGRITFLGAQGSFQRWATIDGCTSATTTDGDCTYQSTCSAGVEIGLCVKQRGGHAPGDANVGWAFLSKFTLP